MGKIKAGLLTTVAGILLCLPLICLADRNKPILERIGVTRGICVVLGDRRCEIALELARQSELLIYVQLHREKDVEKARRIVDEEGFYGTRIFVEKGALAKIHLADNVADAVVVVGKAPKAEVLRVLRPKGKALLGHEVLVKPFPEGVDDWSHPYHGPDNNPQSEDTVIRAPYLTQFLAEPRYAPVPQVAVASAGRVFKAFGHVAFKSREEPLLNKLVAFNGYNGTILWQRDLAEGVMIHRNTMIATPTTLYVGDDKSCKLIDTATGKLKDEIIPPVEKAGGTFWKWMALEDGVLYALMGQQEQRDPTKRWDRKIHGWPWNPISKGFNQPENPWGFGRNVLAIEPKTKKVLWSYREDELVDSRAMCMKNGRIYIFRFGAYLSCLNAKTGKVIWRKTPDNASELFKSLGTYLNRQDYRTNWRTTSYLQCSDKALYFAGPQIGKLLAVSTEDGSILWENPYSNFQLVLRDDGVYGLSGQNDEGSLSKKFDPLTGAVLAELKTARRACTRPTGAIDAIFYRARGGSTRLDLASGRAEWISPMRPQCHDGVTIANGLLYWWPSVCDCQLTLYGITCLGPAGDFDFSPHATEAQRLEKGARNLKKVASLTESSADWPTFRADNTGSATTKATIPEKAKLLWQFKPKTAPAPGVSVPTAPVTVGGLVFVSGPDGIVRALDAVNGRLRWKAYTGGAVRFPPTIWKGRALVGSGDGWVYAFEAQTGRLLWRFRAAPAERKIPVYGSLLSTWPAASGVLVENGIAYVAAGIVNYDGTYVYALDAATGRIKWQNNTSGHLDRQARTGVSVQGHQLLHDGKLYLASGTSLSPAVYNISDGKCLNDPAVLRQLTQNNVFTSQSPRGCELSLLADEVVACGKPFYAHPKYDVFDNTVFNRVFLTSSRGRDVVWVSSQNNKKILCFEHIDRELLSKKMAEPPNRFNVDWKRLGISDKPLWSYDCKDSVALAVCSNAVVVAKKSEIVALNLKDGSVLWSKALPSAPVNWGLAVDSVGRVIVTLEDGQIMCFGGTG
ncbi:MAG: PQQ-binding-like beta-propeller repeat protein [Planctomycetes bacterium]|nr:PQQ-binding-like beta-propeller repeat protein [Planctomycetota bacterium]